MGQRPGDKFDNADSAAIDFGNYTNKKSIEDKSEYASPIFYVKEEDGTIYYTYDEPWNEATENQNNQFSLNWSDKDYYSDDPEEKENRIVAVAHTHGAYDAETNNTKDGFSYPGNSLNSDGISDTSESDRLGVDYYVVTPVGNVYKYGSGSGNEKGTRIATGLYMDPEYKKVYDKTEARLKNRLITRLIKNKFPNATDADIINAVIKYSTVNEDAEDDEYNLTPHYSDTIDELDYYCP